MRHAFSFSPLLSLNVRALLSSPTFQAFLPLFLWLRLVRPVPLARTASPCCTTSVAITAVSIWQMQCSESEREGFSPSLAPAWNYYGME